VRFWDYCNAFVCFILAGVLFWVIFDISLLEAMVTVYVIIVVATWVGRIRDASKKLDMGANN